MKLQWPEVAKLGGAKVLNVVSGLQGSVTVTRSGQLLEREANQ
jgi:hypothetical protein